MVAQDACGAVEVGNGAAEGLGVRNARFVGGDVSCGEVGCADVQVRQKGEVGRLGARGDTGEARMKGSGDEGDHDAPRRARGARRDEKAPEKDAKAPAETRRRPPRGSDAR